MKIKNYCLLTLFSVMLLSCSSDETSQNSISSINKEMKVMNFGSTKEMQNKIDEIVSIREQKELITSSNFAAVNKLPSIEGKSLSENERIVNALKKYHQDVLKDIYELRKETNFVSIRSIADEINSLKLVNPSKANELKEKYSVFLVEEQNLTTTIFDEQLSNILNIKGEVLVNGKKMLLDKKSKSTTGKYLRDEAVNGGVAASLGNLNVYYSAGREVHENDLGFKFYRHYTQLSGLTMIQIGLFPTFVPVPVTYTVNPGSIAGFVQEGSNPFSDYAFTYDYISGFGPVIRNTGGKLNTLYKPAGGNLSATFTVTIDGVQKVLVCNLKYDEIK